MTRRTDDWRTALFWVPVVGVAVFSQAALGAERPWDGGNVTLSLSTLLLCVPMLLRVRRPLLAAALLSAVLPLQMWWGGSLNFGSFVAALVASYSLGRWASLRNVLAGLPLVMLGIVVAMAKSLPQDAAELVIPVFYTVTAAGLGMVVGRLSDQATDLRRLNAVLARERDVSAQLAVASERMRLARDLHDAVAHSLTVAVVQAQDCEESVATDPDRAREASRRIQQVARAGLEDLRQTVRMLRDDEPCTIGPGIHELPALATVMRGAGLSVEVQLEGDLDALSSEQGDAFFRVAQEGLTNVLRHSGADTASVHLVVGGHAATLTVTDPGPVAEAALPSGGRGLLGMTERLEALGGTLAAGAEGEGFAVRAGIPLGGPP